MNIKYPPKHAKPFVKWVGGKQQLLSQLEAFFPTHFTRYIEPFVGGGAVFFHLWNTGRLPSQSFLFDNNEDLINAYQMIRDSVDDLIRCLAGHKNKHSKDYYYKIRGLDRKDRQLEDEQRAARTIYLNRTCYNGLYRVNRKGEFNVPFGSYKNPQILYEDVLRAAHLALQGVTIEVIDFREVVNFAKSKDFFYFDPPYDPVSKTASFTSYTPNSFKDEDQRDLAEVFRQLTQKGCFCMLSNSYTSFILDLYKDFRIELVQAKRRVNSRATGRGNIAEVVVLNH